MKRRKFFGTLLAGIVGLSIFKPKSLETKVGVDPAKAGEDVGITGLYVYGIDSKGQKGWRKLGVIKSMNIENIEKISL
jgi:hypothetical protein